MQMRTGVLDDFRKELIARLEKCNRIDDVITYSQAFEIYGEIVVYLYLIQRGLLTERLSERPGKGLPTSNASCIMENISLSK